MNNVQGENKNLSYRNLSKNQIRKEKFKVDVKGAFGYAFKKSIKRLIIIAICIIGLLLFCSFSYYTLLLQDDTMPKEILQIIREII